ncbi:uncharacterized protein METZ01_LOCUS220791, partial [marine metagenome]
MIWFIRIWRAVYPLNVRLYNFKLNKINTS